MKLVIDNNGKLASIGGGTTLQHDPNTIGVGKVQNVNLNIDIDKAIKNGVMPEGSFIDPDDGSLWVKVSDDKIDPRSFIGKSVTEFRKDDNGRTVFDTFLIEPGDITESDISIAGETIYATAVAGEIIVVNEDPINPLHPPVGIYLWFELEPDEKGVVHAVSGVANATYSKITPIDPKFFGITNLPTEDGDYDIMLEVTEDGETHFTCSPNPINNILK